MKLHQSLKSKVCVLVVALLCATNAFAEDAAVVADENSDTNPTGLVRVEIARDTLAPYKERRGNHGVYFAVGYEALDLKNYISTLDFKSYSEMFGSEPIPLINVNIDYKYNFSLGALTLGINYGNGSLSDDRSGAKRTLSIDKYGLTLKYVADVIMDEPYVAPYVGVTAWQMDISEESPTNSFSARTQTGYNYTVGLLIQLDWLDYDTAKNATFNFGLENTYLDIYATQYAATEALEDPNTETDFLYGAGLRVEF